MSRAYPLSPVIHKSRPVSGTLQALFKGASKVVYSCREAAPSTPKSIGKQLTGYRKSVDRLEANGTHLRGVIAALANRKMRVKKRVAVGGGTGGKGKKRAR